MRQCFHQRRGYRVCRRKSQLELERLAILSMGHCSTERVRQTVEKRKAEPAHDLGLRLTDTDATVRLEISIHRGRLVRGGTIQGRANGAIEREKETRVDIPGKVNGVDRVGQVNMRNGGIVHRRY